MSILPTSREQINTLLILISRITIIHFGSVGKKSTARMKIYNGHFIKFNL